MPTKRKLWQQYSLSQYKILKKKWFWLLMIVLFGFCLRLIAYGFIKIPWIIFDEFIYLDTARQIVRGGLITQLARDPQAYPLGWPLIFSTFSGWISNPYLQYYAVLLFTMLISACVPVLAYYLLHNLWVSLFLSVFPSLFVYSSSIMSESIYIFFLFVLLIILKWIIKDDLKKPFTLWLAALVFGFLLYSARLIRSFAIVYVYSFIGTIILALNLIKRKNEKLIYKEIFKFALLTLLFYFGISLVGNKFLIPETGFYSKTKYMKALFSALKQPSLSFVIVKNQLVMTLFSLFWFLPIFFFVETFKLLKQKKWYLVIPRFWAIGIYIFSFLLTFVHMFIGAQKNPEYLIFSRYLDPIIVVLFAYSLADLFTYLKSRSLKIKLHWLIYLILGYLFWYFVYRFYYGSYKFGNTMPIYYLLNFKDNPLACAFLTALLGVWIYSFIKAKRHLIIYIFIVLFIWLSSSAIINTLDVPKHVIDRYYNRIQDWELSMEKYDYPDVPLCVHIDGITSETYYLYHFLYPYQYLKDCTSYSNKRPKLIITRRRKNINLPNTCVQDFKFRSGESIYYCPLGY